MLQHRTHTPDPGEVNACACVVHCSALQQDPAAGS